MSSREEEQLRNNSLQMSPVPPPRYTSTKRTCAQHPMAPAGPLPPLPLNESLPPHTGHILHSTHLHHHHHYHHPHLHPTPSTDQTRKKQCAVLIAPSAIGAKKTGKEKKKQNKNLWPIANSVPKPEVPNPPEYPSSPEYPLISPQVLTEEQLRERGIPMPPPPPKQYFQKQKMQRQKIASQQVNNGRGRVKQRRYLPDDSNV